MLDRRADQTRKRLGLRLPRDTRAHMIGKHRARQLPGTPLLNIVLNRGPCPGDIIGRHDRSVDSPQLACRGTVGRQHRQHRTPAGE